MRVQLKSDNGLMQIREVPNDVSSECYKYGILIGPPDLSDLDLSKKQIKALNNMLVEAGFGDYLDTRSRRGEIMSIIKELTGEKNKDLLKHILYIYQVSFFED